MFTLVTVSPKLAPLICGRGSARIAGVTCSAVHAPRPAASAHARCPCCSSGAWQQCHCKVGPGVGRRRGWEMGTQRIRWGRVLREEDIRPACVHRRPLPTHTGWKPSSSRMPLVPEPRRRAVAEALLLTGAEHARSWKDPADSRSSRRPDEEKGPTGCLMLIRCSIVSEKVG